MVLFQIFAKIEIILLRDFIMRAFMFNVHDVGGRKILYGISLKQKYRYIRI